jgi:hypothetical protein
VGFLGVPTLRVLFLTLAGVVIWDLSVGKDPITVPQFKGIGYVLLGLGCVSICLPWSQPRIVSGLCGIVIALAIGYVIWIMIGWSIAMDGRFRFGAGPLKVGGAIGKLLAVLLPSLLLTSSIVVIWTELRRLARSKDLWMEFDGH